MHAERDRKKKLIVAFHVEGAGQAGWKCEDCRKQGLEKRRRCALAGECPGEQLVWVRHGVETRQCPVSLITGRSRRWLEMHRAQKLLRAWDARELEYRDLAALGVLEQEEGRLREARRKGQRRESDG